jgi:hypothetical protein
VIVLHGCGGFGTLDQTLAHRLPEHGIATNYVDYFGLTPPPRRKGFATRALPADGPSGLGCESPTTRRLRNNQWKHAQFAAGLQWTLEFLHRHL